MLECSDGSILPKVDNRDLIWDLSSFQKRNVAHDFVLQFENKLCVFSGTVEQLYTNYNIFFPQEENRRLVILPNPYAHHDIFHGVPEDAVKPTGLYIVPNLGSASNAGSKPGSMMLRVPLRTGKEPYRDIPLQVGLRLVNQRRPKHLPLLPVLVKGDLRELDEDTPMLHLHTICLSNIKNLSRLELNNIRRVILERVRNL